ncbi:MAG: hypothetical protein V5A46_07245 [Haloferacaceae archaeon]
MTVPRAPADIEPVVAEVPAYDLPEALVIVLLLATVGTGTVLLLALAAYRRRRSTPYLLVVAAVGGLFLRSTVGFGTMYGRVPMGVHHLVEHALDFGIAACVLAAVYLTGAPSVNQGGIGRESDARIDEEARLDEEKESGTD